MRTWKTLKQPQQSIVAGPRGKGWPVLILGVLLLVLPVPATGGESINLRTEPQRSAAIQALTSKTERQHADAVAMAAQRGWAVRTSTHEGAALELRRLRNGNPVYYITHNANAAISTGAVVLAAEPYLVDGSSILMGLWDAGAVRTTHQEFGGRVYIAETIPFRHEHATHVAGTLVASGIEPSARGMAPAARLGSYYWLDDVAEMAASTDSRPLIPGKIYISNHSYGNATGWEIIQHNNLPMYAWFGAWGEREDSNFGRYSEDTADWDAVAYAAPYYLIFKSAGNDRNDTAPSRSTRFLYYVDGEELFKYYDPASDPFSDSFQSGYDTLPSIGTAKNIVTVGAVSDAVIGGERVPSAAGMATFSSWGPPDDGRIKPDLVANGTSLFSCGAKDDSDYIVLSGTSMSSPNAAGTAGLLAELYSTQFPGEALWASALKGLLIHTADDLGPSGPDYGHGWGLINGQAAADVILGHAAAPSAESVTHSLLDSTGPAELRFMADGTSPIRATLCWTDPPHEPLEGLDNPELTLVNDLELQVIAPDSTVYFPYRLDKDAPSIPATRGVNSADNVERIDIEAGTPPGLYTASISCSGTLTERRQPFSLILTGQQQDALRVRPYSVHAVNGLPTGPFEESATRYQLTNLSDANLTWEVNTPPDWLAVAPQNGLLTPGASVWVEFDLTLQAKYLEPGYHGAMFRFDNLTSGATHLRGYDLYLDDVSTAPQAGIPTITPEDPFTQDALALSYSYSDPNEHEQNGEEIRWYRNGVSMSDFDDQTVLPPEATRSGEAWQAKVRVFDAFDGEASPWASSNAVAIQNRTPEFEDAAALQVHEGDILTFTVPVTDPDGDTISVTPILGSLSERAVFDPQTRVLQWQTGFEDAGDYLISFRATDLVPPLTYITQAYQVIVEDVCRIPEAPTGVQATDGAYANRIVLTFNPAELADEYLIYRNTRNDAASASLIATWDQTTFTDYIPTAKATSALSCSAPASAPATTRYYYWVSARNSCGEGAKSNVDSGYASAQSKSLAGGIEFLGCLSAVALALSARQRPPGRRCYTRRV